MTQNFSLHVSAKLTQGVSMLWCVPLDVYFWELVLPGKIVSIRKACCHVSRTALRRYLGTSREASPRREARGCFPSASSSRGLCKSRVTHALETRRIGAWEALLRSSLCALRRRGANDRLAGTCTSYAPLGRDFRRPLELAASLAPGLFTGPRTPERWRTAPGRSGQREERRGPRCTEA